MGHPPADVLPCQAIHKLVSTLKLALQVRQLFNHLTFQPPYHHLYCSSVSNGALTSGCAPLPGQLPVSQRARACPPGQTAPPPTRVCGLYSRHTWQGSTCTETSHSHIWQFEPGRAAFSETRPHIPGKAAHVEARRSSTLILSIFLAAIGVNASKARKWKADAWHAPVHSRNQRTNRMLFAMKIESTPARIHAMNTQAIAFSLGKPAKQFAKKLPAGAACVTGICADAQGALNWAS
eukprot:1162101-Pelagomonas_calceolata.AAC.12